MPRSLSKKSVKRQTKTVTPAGRILEMKPVAASRARRGGFGLLILTLVAVGCISAAALSFQKMAEAFDYIENTNRDLLAANAKAFELKNKVTDLETLQALSKKTAVSSVPTDLVWDEYSSPNLSLKYPQDYTLTKATSAFPALTIESDKGKIEIFRMKDFPGSVRTADCGDMMMSEEELVKKCPIESPTTKINFFNSTVFPYNIWIYYKQNDQETKAIFNWIAQTIEVKK